MGNNFKGSNIIRGDGDTPHDVVLRDMAKGAFHGGKANISNIPENHQVG